MLKLTKTEIDSLVRYYTDGGWSFGCMGVVIEGDYICSICWDCTPKHIRVYDGRYSFNSSFLDAVSKFFDITESTVIPSQGRIYEITENNIADCPLWTHGVCSFCGIADEKIWKIYKYYKSLKEIDLKIQKRAELASKIERLGRLEALSRKGDLIAFDEWKVLKAEIIDLEKEKY